MIASLKRIGHSQSLKEPCRKKDTDFTRKRMLTFPVVVTFVMNLLTQT